MKRKMLLFTLALPVILFQGVQAQTSSRLVAQTHLVNDGASFVPTDSTNYSYTGSRGGDLTHAMKYDNATAWNFVGDTAYVNSTYNIQTFDGNNNLLTLINEYWSGTGWVLSTKNLYTYDSTNKLILKINQSWGGTSWVPVSQDVYTYIGSKLVEDQYQVWNSLTSTFGNYSQINYYYDPVSGNKINATNINWVSGVPVNVSEYTYTYTTANQLSQTTYSTWNGASWIPATMTTNTYDSSGNRTDMLSQTYDATTSTWVNNTLHLYSSFTAAHNPQTDISQAWDTTGGGRWDNVMQVANTYNAFNQLTSATGESWNIVGAFEFALNDPMARYYYENYTATTTNVSVKQTVAALDGANVYPVPAQNTLHVDLNWNVAQAANIAIYDMTGKVVRQWEAPVGTQYFSAVSVDNLSAGTYFVKINGAATQIVKQFVVAH